MMHTPYLCRFVMTCACVEYWDAVLRVLPGLRGVNFVSLHGKMKQVSGADTSFQDPATLLPHFIPRAPYPPFPRAIGCHGAVHSFFTGLHGISHGRSTSSLATLGHTQDLDLDTPPTLRADSVQVAGCDRSQ